MTNVVLLCKPTVCSICIVVYLCATVNNIKLLSLAMEKQEWVPFAFLSPYLLFSFHCQKYRRLHVTLPIILSDLKTKLASS
jgi:hypothetical protein